MLFESSQRQQQGRDTITTLSPTTTPYLNQNTNTDMVTTHAHTHVHTLIQQHESGPHQNYRVESKVNKVSSNTI